MIANLAAPRARHLLPYILELARVAADDGALVFLHSDQPLAGHPDHTAFTLVDAWLAGRGKWARKVDVCRDDSRILLCPATTDRRACVAPGALLRQAPSYDDALVLEKRKAPPALEHARRGRAASKPVGPGFATASKTTSSACQRCKKYLRRTSSRRVRSRPQVLQHQDEVHAALLRVHARPRVDADHRGPDAPGVGVEGSARRPVAAPRGPCGYSFDESRRRRGRDVDSLRRRVAATPRPLPGNSVETSRRGRDAE